MSWDCRRCGRLCRPLEPACPACTWSRPPGPCRDKTLIFKYPLPKADAHKARETKRLYKGHFKTPYCLKIVGRMMYTGSWDRTAASWDLESETMVLAGQARLLRVNISSCTDPVVRLTGWFSNLRGSGSISTTNAAPRWVAVS